MKYRLKCLTVHKLKCHRIVTSRNPFREMPKTIHSKNKANYLPNRPFRCLLSPRSHLPSDNVSNLE